MKFGFVDLFCGIGGFHLALTTAPLAGFCVYACDIDPECREIYDAYFELPPHRLGGDVREVTEPNVIEGATPTPTALRLHIESHIPPHEVLCAGFPCQPFSKSGHQRGIDETRGTLFYDILRVLEVRRPQFVLLENVMNLVGPRHEGTWRTIVQQLRDLGYATSDEPTVLSPHAVPEESGGRPQHRQRVFIPGIHVGAQALEFLSLGPLVDPIPFGSLPNWRVVDFLTDNADNDLEVRDEHAMALDVWNEIVHGVSGKIPGIPLWADVWRGLIPLSTAWPDWKNKIISANIAFQDENVDLIREWLSRHNDLADLYPSHRKLEWQAGAGERDIWKHAVQFRPSGIRVRPLTYLPALVAINQTSIIGPLRRRISVLEAARLQGFPDDFPFRANSGSAYRQLGNAVSVGVTNFVARALLLGTALHPGEQAPIAWVEARRRSDAIQRDGALRHQP